MVVALGDHKQLAPFTTVDERNEQNTSFFELMLKKGIKNVLLDVQYRMHPDISRFPVSAFYGNRVFDFVNLKNLRLPGGFEWKNSRHVAFINVEGTEMERNTSKYNSTEAKVVKRLVRKIQKKEENMRIAIITFYSEQVSEIKNRLGDKPGVVVETVDAYQGQERDVVVISFVRCNKMGRVGFVADARRLNVAFTRAKNAMLVVGNRDTLVHNPLLKAWFDEVDKMDCSYELEDIRKSKKRKTRKK